MRNIYAIYDKVAFSQVGALVMQAHDGPVSRLFFDLLADQDQPMAKHPGDYELWKIASIDDDLVVYPMDHVVVATGMQYLLSNEKLSEV